MNTTIKLILFLKFKQSNLANVVNNQRNALSFEGPGILKI
jgi:hypothetical protein